jgi:hypothetical protein
VPHPDSSIEGPAAFAAIPLLDEQGRSVVVAVTKASFAFDARGGLAPLEPQPPVTLAPRYHGDPATSSLQLDADIALAKLATDVVVLGHARSHRGPVESLDAGVRIGPVKKVARVVGDRVWTRTAGTVVLSRPQPFTEMPLVYERAFGGWDRSHPDPRRHSCEPRNPVGIGFGTPLAADGASMPAPNIVTPEQPAPAYGEVVEPVGFGFVAPHWQPRAGFAGTYDDAWDKARKPLLPTDFSRRYFSAASAGLVSAEHLRGEEPVTLINIGGAARVDFRLPAAAPAATRFFLRGGRESAVTGLLDTVVIDADAMHVSLVWRASIATRDGIQDVVAIKARCDLALSGAA